MKHKKIATTPERAAATSTTDNTQIAQLEQSTILKHLLKSLPLSCDQAYLNHGIRHLHSIIPKLECFIPICRKYINSVHPERGYIRQVKQYWIKPHIIDLYMTKEGRDKLKKEQTRLNIAKSRANDNKAFQRLCRYCTFETMSAKLHEIYGQQAANDD